MENRRLAGLLIPLVLVAAGVVLLLNTLGIVAWRAWDTIARLWPVLIIGFGVYVLLRNLRRP